ncbi:MAG: recombinase RecT [Gemmatimonadaceae bacterium]|nr:recombinase RecT [Gemmatimonadaceae bacterium]
MTQTVAKPNGQTDLALMKRTTVDAVTDRVRGLLESKELHLPPGYSAENALKAAWLVLQEVEDKNKRPALSVCTQNSIANSLFSMVVQGLDPMKKQAYFIVRGTQLTLLRSYFGTIAAAKRMAGVIDVYAEAVYEGDEFEYEIDRGIKRVTKHKQSLGSIDPSKIVGAYAVVDLGPDREQVTEIMAMTQIRTSWSKGYANGPQKDQPDEMARRTVVNRALKRFINSSNDDHLGLFVDHFNRSDMEPNERAELEVGEDARERANRQLVDFDDEHTIDVETRQAVDEAPDSPDATGGMSDEEAEEIRAREIAEAAPTLFHDEKRQAKTNAAPF